ncbi:MAG: haloacid dehalogenase-like hydrolase [Nanoarchaeota archaeon]
MKSETRLAIFDIDGPLTKDFGIFHYAEFLTRAGLFDGKILTELDGRLDGFRNQEFSYAEFASSLVKLFGVGLQGKKASEVRMASEGFHDVWNSLLRDYALPLVRMMKDNGFIPVAITSTPLEALDSLNSIIPFETVRGIHYEIHDGHYTGRLEQESGFEKGKVLDDLVRQYTADLNRSFAFGDSVADIPLFQKAGYPIALNPDKELSAVLAEHPRLAMRPKQDILAEVAKFVHLRLYERKDCSREGSEGEEYTVDTVSVKGRDIVGFVYADKLTFVPWNSILQLENTLFRLSSNGYLLVMNEETQNPAVNMNDSRLWCIQGEKVTLFRHYFGSNF